MEHIFTTYVRTKAVFQHRLKDLKTYDTVKIYLYELTKLGVKGATLYGLRQTGEIWYDDDGNFKTLKIGPIDPKLLEITRKWPRVKAPLTPLHIYMKEQLKLVTIVDTPKEDLPVYFKAFLEHRDDDLDLFFSVDGFSGRVHSPVVNLKSTFRSKLRLKHESLCSLDVKQMQPTILAQILSEVVGDNPFSKAINDGKDVYVTILNQNPELKDRQDAKKFLYQLIFGKPTEEIGSSFKGDNTWVKWINHYKGVNEPSNPHGKHRHTNLAWLLQSKEVQAMTSIWEKLYRKKIPFLSIHDDILVRKSDFQNVSRIFKEELTKHFKAFEITSNCY